ncbi:MAG: hypothetical protein JNL17_15950 [Cyclobacteriaceae bacterium]|nr:hypothetical protein [Cyclobacteriaceae bacterium]
MTGKLSDIAGLFIFPFFWSIFFFKHELKVYLLTALIFVVWKTPLSTDLINWTNHTFGTEFSRIVDYTDLVTLLILPISYRHFKRNTDTNIDHNFRIVQILILGISIFAFVATTLPRKEVNTNLQIGEPYIVNLSKQEIFTNRMEPARGLSDSLKSNMIDSLFFIEFDSEGHDLMAEVKIYAVDTEKTMIEFVSLTSYTVTGGLFSGFDEEQMAEMEKLKKEDYKRLFESGVIEVMKNKNRFESDIFYWNPKLDPVILERN